MFFALLSKILLQNPNISTSASMAVILGGMSLVPPITAFEEHFKLLGKSTACCVQLLKRLGARRQDEPASPGNVGVELRPTQAGAVVPVPEPNI